MQITNLTGSADCIFYIHSKDENVSKKDCWRDVFLEVDGFYQDSRITEIFEFITAILICESR